MFLRELLFVLWAGYYLTPWEYVALIGVLQIFLMAFGLVKWALIFGGFYYIVSRERRNNGRKQ